MRRPRATENALICAIHSGAVEHKKPTIIHSLAKHSKYNGAEHRQKLATIRGNIDRAFSPLLYWTKETKPRPRQQKSKKKAKNKIPLFMNISQIRSCHVHAAHISAWLVVRGVFDGFQRLCHSSESNHPWSVATRG